MDLFSSGKIRRIIKTVLLISEYLKIILFFHVVVIMSREQEKYRKRGCYSLNYSLKLQIQLIQFKN